MALWTACGMEGKQIDSLRTQLFFSCCSSAFAEAEAEAGAARAVVGACISHVPSCAQLHCYLFCQRQKYDPLCAWPLQG